MMILIIRFTCPPTSHFKFISKCDRTMITFFYISFKVYPKLKMLNRVSSFLSLNVLLKIYKLTILPISGYGIMSV